MLLRKRKHNERYKKYMNGMTQSILLQVAFKEAVSSVNAQGIYTDADVKTRTGNFYKLLLELHNELGIDSDDGRGGRSGGRSSYTPKSETKSAPQALPASVIRFNVDGVDWLDYRKAKTDGDVKPRFPSFKTADFKTSVFETDQDGNPNPEAAILIAAADTAKQLDETAVF